MEKNELKPAAVFEMFARINNVPRPSKREEKMIAFLKDFGESLGLETKVDETGNVLIRKPASKGMEQKPTVILQSHMDMVCEKNNDVDFNFDTDGIQSVEGQPAYSALYDLSGRKLQQKPTKGIYIQNGKKLLVK